MMLMLWMALLTNSSLCKADVFHLTEVNVEFKKFQDGSINPLIETLPNKVVNQELNLNVNIALLDVLYFNNKIHSYTSKDLLSNGSQFALVGWNYQLGLHLSPYVDLFFDHFSQHLLDASFPYHFPVENSIGFKIFLYKNKKEDNLYDTFGFN